MKPDEIFFRDVTDDSEAAQKVVQRGPELRAALLACGFAPVGLAEFRAPSAALQLEMLAITNPDAELIRDAAVNGEVDEVMTSPDRRALAAVENAFGGSVVSIRTLLEDGRIVETTMKPTRPPQNLDPLGTVLTGNTSSQNLPLQATAKLMQLGTGKMPLWPRGDWPHAGYHVELVDTRDVNFLWQHHQRRLAGIQQNQPTEIRSHVSVPLYCCFSCRTNEVQKHHAKWNGYFSKAIMALFLLAIPLTLIGMGPLTAALKPLKATSGGMMLLIFIPILFMLGVALAAMLLMGLSRTIVGPLVHGPRLRSVPELLAEVQQRMRTTLPPPPALTERQQKALADLKRAGERRTSPASPGRIVTIMQLLVFGGMLGFFASNQAQATTVDLLLRVLAINLLFGGMLAGLWGWGFNLKTRVATAALTGGALELIYQLMLYPLGRPWSIIMAIVFGIIFWAAVYLLFWRRTNKTGRKEDGTPGLMP